MLHESVLVPSYKLFWAGTVSSTSAEPAKGSLKIYLMVHFSLHLRNLATPDLPGVTETLGIWCCGSSLQNKCPSTRDFTVVSGEFFKLPAFPLFLKEGLSTSLVVLKTAKTLVSEILVPLLYDLTWFLNSLSLSIYIRKMKLRPPSESWNKGFN